MGTLSVCRPADYLPSGTVGQWPPATGQWWNARRGGDPKTYQVTQGADPELPGWQPKEKATQLPQKRGTLKSAWVASVHTKGGGPSPVFEVKGPKDPWRRDATECNMLSRQLQLRNGWTVARIGPIVVFVSLLDKRSVELTGCPVCFLRPASRGLPLAESA